MLVEFSVENFLSFRDKVTFSMLASEDTSHENTNVIKLDNGKRYLKTAVVYGANASGKSNLLKAMDFMSEFVRRSRQIQINEEIGVKPFKLNEACLNKPSKFDIIFYGKDNLRYAYGFSVTNSVVFNEYLYCYPNEKEEIIFDRFDVNVYKFSDSTDSLNRNYKRIDEAFKWLSSFRLHSSSTIIETVQSFIKDKDILKLDIIKEWIKLNDTGISNVNIDFSDRLLKLSPNTDDVKEIFNDVTTIYQPIDNNKKKHSINMLEASEGVRKLFTLALDLNFKVYKQMPLFVDDMDIHLHPLLLRYIICNYGDFDINKDKSSAQLILTSNNSSLLDSTLFRRDQIWFTEKNPDNGATDLYSLYDFSDMKEESNIEEGYLIGLYGAIPFML